jgi:hypothetical protein
MAGTFSHSGCGRDGLRSMALPEIVNEFADSVRVEYQYYLVYWIFWYVNIYVYDT